MSRNAMQSCIDEVNDREDERRERRREWLESCRAGPLPTPLPTHICPACARNYYAAGECDWHPMPLVRL